MDFRPSEEQELLRRSVREFAETEIRPHVREWDQDQHFPIELVRKMAALGLLGIQIPEQYGGAAMRTTAARAGECWVINGSKAFTTHGSIGDVMVVVAVTDRGAGTKGI